MAKRVSLAQTMRKIARPEGERQGAAPAATAEPRPAERGAFYAATRAGKKKLTAPLSEAAHQQFRILAAERGTKGEALLIEAINDLFEKYGKPPIA